MVEILVFPLVPPSNSFTNQLKMAPSRRGSESSDSIARVEKFRVSLSGEDLEFGRMNSNQNCVMSRALL